MIKRVFELKEEIATFLEENQHEDVHLWNNEEFIVEIAYMVEIFGKLSSLNKTMQRPQMHSLVQKDKLYARKSKYFVVFSDRNKEKNNESKMPFKFKKEGLRREIPKDLILRAIEEVSKGSKIKTTADNIKSLDQVCNGTLRYPKIL
ncbi:hypothetical protein WA026_016819 [Henosepilachna vigintioctopunctata]|uniref:Uncharacterized protein n=1 Tax=Henosepilachna vigintioctopunctata TaxID=420089 RepID=A0AAW1V3U5_9CUCU